MAQFLPLSVPLTTALAIAAAGLMPGIGGAHAQDLEPRSYSASPIGTNFLASGYSRTNGRVSLDPSLPITGVKAGIDTYTLGYDRTFDLAGRSASAAILLPYLHGYLSGQVEEQSEKGSRAGLGDLRWRLAVNPFGGPPRAGRVHATRADHHTRDERHCRRPTGVRPVTAAGKLVCRSLRWCLDLY